MQLPSNFSNYIIYKLVFKDEMSKGLTYNNDARIYFGAGDTTGTPISFDVTEGSAQFGAEGKTYTYTIANLKTDAYAAYNLTNGDTIRITYTATLNENAVIGEVGNPNAFVCLDDGRYRPEDSIQGDHAHCGKAPACAQGAPRRLERRSGCARRRGIRKPKRPNGRRGYACDIRADGSPCCWRC